MLSATSLLSQRDFVKKSMMMPWPSPVNTYTHTHIRYKRTCTRSSVLDFAQALRIIFTLFTLVFALTCSSVCVCTTVFFFNLTLSLLLPFMAQNNCIWRTTPRVFSPICERPRLHFSCLGARVIVGVLIPLLPRLFGVKKLFASNNLSSFVLFGMFFFLSTCHLSSINKEKKNEKWNEQVFFASSNTCRLKLEWTIWVVYEHLIALAIEHISFKHFYIDRNKRTRPPTVINRM